MTETIPLTAEMIAVIAVLFITVILFVFEVFRVDVVAILIMVILALSGFIPNLEPLILPDEVFNGFASNAVISIIAVMIIGAGLDKTGALNSLAAKILQVAGNTEQRVMTLVSFTVGVISGFMQNIGAAALFLPVVDRISKRSGVSLSRLLMPMGYCAILGGTLTMVGSSPLILLNDLLANSNNNLPAHVPPMESFGLFSVTPIGAVLLLCGLVYFYLFSGVVIQAGTVKSLETGTVASYVQDIYGITGQIYELFVRSDSRVVGATIGDVEDRGGYDERVIAINIGGNLIIEPSRNTEIVANCDIAVMGRYEQIVRGARRYRVDLKKEISVFQEAFNPTTSGIAEIVIPPSSTAVGKTVGDIGFRRNYRVTMLAVYRDEQPIREDLQNLKFQSGDTLVVHSLWTDLQRFARSLEFVVVTDYPREDFRPKKLTAGLFSFLVSMGLVLFTDLKLAAALMTGATLMIITGVIKIEEAYRSIGWQSIFLLASLIPLGLAVENTQTASWIAQQFVALLMGVPEWIYLLALALLATIFTLVMSNVGATVLLVPIAVNIAVQIGANPSVFALTVAVATSNSFLIPTHQVNALIQAPGGYRVADFLRAGSMMTVLFLAVVILMMQLLY